MRVFKDELREALGATRASLPGDELFKAVDYDDESDERFLRRLWRDLFGGEPAAGDQPTEPWPPELLEEDEAGCE